MGPAHKIDHVPKSNDLDGMWGSGISRDQLLQKISLLAMLGGVRDGLQAHSLTTSGDIEHGLTIEQEAEIAGNLAFLSRRRHDPKSVAAISIEQDGHGQGMIVRLCVNGGILSGVEEGLKQICALLEEISRCQNSESRDIDLLLQKVVELDYSRISARLKLARRYDSSSSSILQLHQAFRSQIAAQANPETREKINKLASLCRALKDISVHSTQQNSHRILESIIKLSHDLARSTGFDAAMNSLHATNTKIAELSNVILKLGQYYRATSQLVRAARRKRYGIFQKINVQTFQTEVPPDITVHSKPGSSIPLIRNLASRLDISNLLQRFRGSEPKTDASLIRRLNNTRSGIKVHAEIKLLFFYEAHPEIKKPRIISANKSSCYLCDLFFKLHGVFQLPSTFGMLCERWILPDWCAITPGRAEHLRNTLIEFDKVLDSQLVSLLKGRKRLPDPMQSMVALSAFWLSSQDTIQPRFEAVSDLLSIHSYTSSVLPSFADKKLTQGKKIWRQLRGNSSLILHFYETYIVLSSSDCTENSDISPSWVRVSLKSLHDNPELQNTLNRVILEEIEEGTDRTIEGIMRPQTQFHIIWKYLAVSILICSSRLGRKRIGWSTSSI